MEALNGYKTYLVALGVVIAAVVAFLNGETNVAEAVNQVLVGLGLATIRHGVANS